MVLASNDVETAYKASLHRSKLIREDLEQQLRDSQAREAVSVETQQRASNRAQIEADRLRNDAELANRARVEAEAEVTNLQARVLATERILKSHADQLQSERDRNARLQALRDNYSIDERI